MEVVLRFIPQDMASGKETTGRQVGLAQSHFAHLTTVTDGLQSELELRGDFER